MPRGSLLAVRDDQDVAGVGAGAGHRVSDRALDPLTGKRLPAGVEAGPVRLGLTQQLPRRSHAGLGRRLRAADPVELRPALDSAPGLELLTVNGQRDAVGAQPVCHREREVGRHHGALEAERPAGSCRHLEQCLGPVGAAQDKLVVAKLLDRVDLDPAAHRGDTRSLKRGDHRMAHAADLGVQERVGHVQWELVAELGMPDRVAEDQDVSHAGRHVVSLAATGRASPRWRRAPVPRSDHSQPARWR